MSILSGVPSRAQEDELMATRKYPKWRLVFIRAFFVVLSLFGQASFLDTARNGLLSYAVF